MGRLKEAGPGPGMGGSSSLVVEEAHWMDSALIPLK